MVAVEAVGGAAFAERLQRTWDGGDALLRVHHQIAVPEVPV